MSVSSVSLSSDVNVRYQRLAQEYTKLRAQAKVLREGVLEERGKVEKLTEDVKSKEATIRRLQSENESLTFRNDQLVCRVENFQFEPQKQQKSANSIDPNLQNRLELLENELQAKIQQNERLVGELAENERRHAVEMAEMSEKLAKEMRKLEDEVKRMRIRTKAGKEEKETEKVEIPEVSQKIDEELVIGSPEPPESQEEARIMVTEAVRGTFSALNNVFNLLQQRCEIYPYDVTMERLPAHVEKLSSEYAQTARLFSSLVEISDSILQNAIFQPDLQLPEITSKCRLISQHCQQMLRDLVSQMTGEENRVTWCTPPLSKLNLEWESLILRVFDVFDEITTCLETSQNIDSLLNHLDSLDTVTSSLLECFQKRWIFESRLPTTTRRMRCVGSALEEALQMASGETSKLAARARRIQIMVAENLPSKVEEKKGVNPFFDDLEEEEEPETPKATDFAAHSEDPTPSEAPVIPKKFDLLPLLQEDPTPSESPEPPVIPQKVRKASAASSSVPNDLESLGSAHKASDSEIRRLQAKNLELQKERDRLFVDNSLVKRKLEIATSELTTSSEIGKTDLDQIWDIGMNRRDEWIQRVHDAEKALRFYEIEFDLLLRHELASEEHLKQVLAELEDVAKQNHRLEDELESVRRSYESQLGDLSEHLATLVKEREKEKESNKSRGSLKSFFNKS